MAIAPRVVVTAVFALGILVYVAVIRTFRSWADEIVYVRNPNDHFDVLENSFQDGHANRQEVNNDPGLLA